MKKLSVFVAFLAVSLCVFAAPPAPDTEWVYKTVDGKDLKLSVFLPKGYETGKNFPVYMAFHGGSWKEGSPAMQFPDCAYWARHGMVGVSAEYRLRDRDRVKVPLECVKDAKSAIRFLRANAARLKIDTARVVVAGDSAGGQLAAATAMIHAPATNDAQDDLSISCRPDALILFNPWFKCEPELSPPAHVASGQPPVMTFLGDNDVIPLEKIRDFHDSLLNAGGDSMLLVGHGGTHGFCNGRNPANPFFYWSLDHVGRFLAGHGILPVAPRVEVPQGVKVLEAGDYTVHSRSSSPAGIDKKPDTDSAPLHPGKTSSDESARRSTPKTTTAQRATQQDSFGDQ